MKFDARRKKLARIETAVAALRSQRKVLRVIVDQAEEAEERMQASLAEHLARYPEDAGRTVADFDWITRVVLPIPAAPVSAIASSSLTASSGMWSARVIGET